MANHEGDLSLRSVLMNLRQQKLVDDQAIEQIEREFEEQKVVHHEPWFVKFLLAVGAWVAAICFLLFLGIIGLIEDDAWVLLGWGTFFIITATAMRQSCHHLFLVQLALAMSTMGHGLTLTGTLFIDRGFNGFGIATLVSLALCVILYFLYPDNLHRFLSCLLPPALATLWIGLEIENWLLLHLIVLIQVSIIGMVFIYNPRRVSLRPLGYATAFSLSIVLFLVILPDRDFQAPWWPSNVILAAALIWLFQWIAGGWNKMRNEPMIIATAATMGLATITTPGILSAIGLMVLGYARNDRYLLSMGMLFFPCFIVIFYYEWQTSLMMKSWIIGGSGAILLLVRWFLSFRGWARVES